MSKPIHIDWIAKNALDGTMQLGPWEELAYRRIIDMIYASDDNLLDNDESLKWSTKTGAKWPKIKQSLIALNKIQIVSGRITNAVCREKLSEARVRITSARNAGYASSDARKSQKNNKTAPTDVGGSVGTDWATEGQPITNYQLPSTSEDKSSEDTPKKYSDDFEKLLWLVWPQSRRCEKPSAWKAWKEACRKLPADQLGECIQRYLEKPEAKPDKKGQIFAPYPAKWLKRERWLEVMQEKDGVSKANITLADLGDETEENRIFFGVLENLKRSRGEAIFRSWLSQLRIHHKNCSVLTLSAPSKFVVEWIKTHYSQDLKSAVSEAWPEITTVVIQQKVAA